MASTGKAAFNVDFGRQSTNGAQMNESIEIDDQQQES